MIRKLVQPLLACISLLLATPMIALAAPPIKGVKLTVTNPTSEARPAEDIVVSIAEIKRIAPDFKAVMSLVTTNDAAKLDQDARSLLNGELPSQADDLDGDGKLDELAFQIDLQPKQTRVVMIAYSDHATMMRLRSSDYPKRTHAKFTQKFDGLGWESDVAAWRLYFDPRNAIDVYGKRRPGLYLELYGTPKYNYAGSQEYSEPTVMMTGSPKDKRGNGSALYSKAIKTREEFIAYAKQQRARLAQPAKITLR